MMNNILIAKVLINQKEGSFEYIIVISQKVFAIFSIRKVFVPYFGIYSEEIILIPIILNRLQCEFLHILTDHSILDCRHDRQPPLLYH